MFSSRPYIPASTPRTCAAYSGGIRQKWLIWPALLSVAFLVSDAAAGGEGCGSAEPTQVKAVPAPDPAVAPRLVCDETSVTIEPLWRGEQIACEFLIRNDGRSNLDIKAKGG
jgi:hypothetical protein